MENGGRPGAALPRRGLGLPGLLAPLATALTARRPGGAGAAVELAGGGRPRAAADPGRRALLSTAAALVLWLSALPHVDVRDIDGYGLLGAFPVRWYLAYAALLALVGVALLARRPSTAALLWPAGGLVLMLFATTSLVYDAPRFPWTYKHVGVAEYLLHAPPDLGLDIYQNFPGFFYLADAVSLVTRIPLLDLAQWSELGFTVLNALAVFWALGALTRSRRLQALATLLFTLTNWVGQAYFSPQSLALPLSLVVLGGVLRAVAAGHGRPRHRRLLDTLTPGARWARPGGLALLALAFAAIAVSHQLTPVSLLLQLGALVVLLVVTRPWLVVALAAVEGLWIWHAFPFLSTHFPLLEGTRAGNLRPPASAGAVLPGAGLVAQGPHAAVLFVAAGAVVAVLLEVRRTRSLRTVLLPSVLAVVPGLVLVVQPYGQEGILRFFLYALPWLSLLIGRELLRLLDPAGSAAARLSAVALVLALGVVALPTTYGLELVNHVYGSDVAVDQHFERSTPDASVLLLLVAAYPSRTTSDYPQHVVNDDPFAPSLQALPGFAAAARSPQALAALTDDYFTRQTTDRERYLALGPTQEAYARLFGVVSEGAYRGYVDLLSHDPHFEVVFREGSSLLLHYRPPAP